MDKLAETLQSLRQLTQVSVQKNWHIATPEQNLAELDELSAEWRNWAIAEPNPKDHLAWDKGQQRVWMVQNIEVPAHLKSYDTTGLKLYLALTWWADQAEIWVDGQLVQSGDLFDCSARILLSDAAQPGTIYRVCLDLVSPGHDPGALVRSVLMFESPNDEAFLEPSFVADELQGLHTYLQAFEPERVAQFMEALETLDWGTVRDRTLFQTQLKHLRQQLAPLAASLRERQVHLVGHAHLDLAWLWPIAETWNAAERTFKSVLTLQQDFPELIFCHSSPALFDGLEQNHPELFAAIQAKVAAGTFEIAAGLWVEPELNLIDGESIVRQILHGQQYTQAKFGAINRIAWVPDTFGFCWQLPQLLRQGGIDYFVTQKLRWNDTTKFPYDAFWWRSPDGTAIFSLMTALIGQEINPIKITDYVCEWEQKTQIPDSLWLPGVGDHGGGPTKDMLQTARRWQNSPFFPQMKFSTVLEYLQKLQPEPTYPPESLLLDDQILDDLILDDLSDAQCLSKRDYPIWDSELYLEFHRGCYTTHADQKRLNRRSEILLYQAELYAALASMLTGCDYPQAEITQAWKGLLFNQFHDILPGSSIPEVYVEAQEIWENVTTTGQKVLGNALQEITRQIQLPSPPVPEAIAIAVFNPLHWSRTDVVTLTNPDTRNYQVLNANGDRVGSESPSSGQTQFLATDLPGLGYQVYWLCPIPDSLEQNVQFPVEFVLENENLRVEIDPKTGNLASLIDRTTQREALSEPGNQLQFFQDQGQYWDAWNIDPNYAEHPLPEAQLDAIAWIEFGELRQRLRVVRTFQSSRFQQDYVLDAGSSLLKIETVVDWQERHVLVKAAFPLDIENGEATYETPFAAIARPNHPETPAEKAMWEVPALRWADLSNDDYGVSLLNDCKYGYDCQGNQLRLTLLRGSVWPNPEADRGLHEFTYAIYPHPDRWQSAQVVRQGYCLNQPPITQMVLGGMKAIAIQSVSLPTTGQFLQPWPENLVLTAWKRSEGDPQQWILRCYEAHGRSANFTIQSSMLSLEQPQKLDLLENPMPRSRLVPDVDPELGELTIQPWQVCTFRIK